MLPFRVVIAAFLLSTPLLAATPRPNLSGTVLDSNGSPLPGVTVMVYHAGVKTGYNVFCPSCYTDCGKRVFTDAHGTFKIESLAPDLWFTLLAASDGYVPEITTSIDPFKTSTVSVKLTAKPKAANFSGTVRGRLVETDGSPVPNALIKPVGLIDGAASSYGTLPGLQPIAVTNKEGNFEISYSKPTPKMLLEIEGRGLAPKFAVMETGPDRHFITLTDGATIAGRLLQNGRPIPNAQIGLIPKHRGGFINDLKATGEPYDVVRIGTDSNGRFVIPNVPAPVDWYIYPTMDSISSIGAATPLEVHASKDAEYVKAPDLVIHPGLHIRGRIITSDHKPIASGMRITLGSETVWDSQTAILAPDGSYELINIPPGKYNIALSVKGYHANTGQYGPEPFSLDHNLDDFTTVIYPDTP